jgi:hypothetical protein
MHTGEFATLDDVLDHYNGGGRFFGMGGNELQSLALDSTERAQIKSFLLTLTGAGAPGAARSGDRGAQ